MSERSKTISRLLNHLDARISYINAKLSVVVPSKIKALRLRSNMPRQSDLARAANMQQSRISMFETPGAANMTVETLARIAAAFRVGLIIDFVPFSRMLDWENNYSQDTFDVIKIDNDMAFLNPAAAGVMQIGGYLPLSNAMGAGCRSETIGSNAGATSNMGQRLQRATGMEHEPIQKMNGEQIDGREKRAA